MNFEYKVNGKNVEIRVDLKETDKKVLQLIEDNLQGFLPDLKINVVPS